MKKSLASVVMAAIALSGCIPGETKFSLKTSEIRKALRGEPAHIRATICAETVLSNAYDKVTFGDGKYKNKLDFIRSMMKDDTYKKIASFDKARMWIDESDKNLPTFKSEISVEILLATKPVLESLKGTAKSKELCVLEIDAEKGTIGEMSIGKGKDFNQPMCAMTSFLYGQCSTAEALLGKKSAEELMIVPMTLLHALLPTWSTKLTVEIVGDGPPIYFLAEDITIKGKTMKRAKGCVKRGEGVTMELDKKMHGENGGLHFMLEPPSR